MNANVPCPLAVAWISFILVVIERVHGICKYLNSDGSPLNWRVWSLYNTHHMVMFLQFMPWYFSTVPNSERKTFIFYPAYFLLEAVTYQHNLLMKFCGWNCTSPENLVHTSFNVQRVLCIRFPWYGMFEYLTHKILHIFGCCFEHRNIEVYWF